MKTLLNENKEITKQKELDKNFSIFLAKTILEGYTLENSHPMSTEYVRMLVLIDQKRGHRYGLGLKRINICSNIEEIHLEYGKLKQNSIYEYENKNVILEKFNLIKTKDYNNPIYVSLEKGTEIKKIQEERKELKYKNRHKPIREFEVDKLNIPGLKRPGKAKITVTRKPFSYVISKDNKPYKQIRF